MPGTPLHAEHQAKGTLLREIDHADIRGQLAFNFVHPHISREESGKFLLRAFERDYAVNGPSVMRIARTLLEGLKRHRNHPEKRVRERFRHEAQTLAFGYAGALWAMEHYFRSSNAPLTEKIRQLRADFRRELGLASRIVSPVIGGFVYQMIRLEERRLNRGWTYQPPMFVEQRNWERLTRPMKSPALEPIPQTQ
jgi:hypothetical protein